MVLKDSVRDGECLRLLSCRKGIDVSQITGAAEMPMRFGPRKVIDGARLIARYDASRLKGV